MAYSALDPPANIFARLWSMLPRAFTGLFWAPGALEAAPIFGLAGEAVIPLGIIGLIVRIVVTAVELSERDAFTLGDGHPVHNVIWRQTNVTSGETTVEGMLDLKVWDRGNLTALGCWKDSPEHCGTMYDYRPRCQDWMVGHYPNEWDGWMWGPLFTPNGSLEAVLPDGKDFMKAQWIMEFNDELIEKCIDLLPPGQQPKESWYHRDMNGQWDGDEWNALTIPNDVWASEHGIPGRPYRMPEVDYQSRRRDVAKRGDALRRNDLSAVERESRHETAMAELESHFAELPTFDKMNEMVDNGAALVHKHMGNHSVLRAKVLYTAMSSIINRSQKKSMFWNILRRGSVPKTAVVQSLFERVAEGGSEQHKHGLHALASGALIKTVRERIEAGDEGLEEHKMIHWLFDRVHGEA